MSGGEREEFRRHVAETISEMAELRRMLSGITALTQQLSTIITAAVADDWEDRYLAEGSMAVEAFANGEEPTP